jgi:small-conductance mechanosensitive channel
MNGLLQQSVSLSLFAKCLAAVVGILIIHGVFCVVERTLPLRFGRADSRYEVRKFIVFAGYVAMLLFLAILFEDRLGRLSVTLGVGAGVAVALQDVVASVAGAFSMAFSKLYTVGDRVQIGDTRGDVIGIGLLRTTMMETGNWVSNDLYNGRIVRIPNSIVSKTPVFNYSQGFRFVWDEINVLFTTASDCQLAREMLLRAAKEAIGEYLVEAHTSWKAMSDYYRSANPPLEPTVALVVNAGSLEFSVSTWLTTPNEPPCKISCSRKSSRKLRIATGSSHGHHRQALSQTRRQLRPAFTPSHPVQLPPTRQGHSPPVPISAFGLARTHLAPGSPIWSDPNPGLSGGTARRRHR